MLNKNFQLIIGKCEYSFEGYNHEYKVKPIFHVK